MTSCPVWGYGNFRPIKIKRYVLLLCLNAAGLLTRSDRETSEKTRHITSLFIEPRSIFQPQLFNRIWDKNNTDHVPTRHYSAGKSCLHGMQSDAVIHPNTLTDQAHPPRFTGPPWWPWSSSRTTWAATTHKQLRERPEERDKQRKVSVSPKMLRIQTD